MIITDLSILRQQSLNANEKEAFEIVALLDEELSKANQNGANGIGLAASQIGILKKVAIIRVGNIKINLVNCSISDKQDLKDSKEGCLSIPNQTCPVKRYNQITIADNHYGNLNNFSAFDLISVCIQHEMDHWDGKLMLDRVVSRNIGDNELCSCGSGIKYKKCCKRKI